MKKSTPPAPVRPLAELQRALVNLRFGMFIHFSPTSYLDIPDQLLPDHSPPRQGKDGIAGTGDDLSPALVNPKKLDCGQWADAAKSAGMRFAVLSTTSSNVLRPSCEAEMSRKTISSAPCPS